MICIPTTFNILIKACFSNKKQMNSNIIVIQNSVSIGFLSFGTLLEGDKISKVRNFLTNTNF